METQTSGFRCCNPKASPGYGCETPATLHTLCPDCKKLFSDDPLFGKLDDERCLKVSVRNTVFDESPGANVYFRTWAQLKTAVQDRCHFCALLHHHISAPGRDACSSGAHDHQRAAQLDSYLEHSNSTFSGIRISFREEFSLSFEDGDVLPEYRTEIIIQRRQPDFMDASEAGSFHDRLWPDFLPPPERPYAWGCTSSHAYLKMARYWINCCLIQHEARCSKRGPGVNNLHYRWGLFYDDHDDFTPSRLIHIETDGARSFKLSLRVTSNNLSLKYATLSHCWGGRNDILKLRTSNIAELQDSIPYSDLPRNFQEVIVVCNALGLQYVWIDSLCIMQDSEEDWAKEAAVMDIIYQKSFITIAAAAAPNPHYGLFTRADPLIRSPCRLRADAEGGDADLMAMPLSCTRQAIMELVKGSPLFKRGWVLQEMVISPRVLIFAEGHIAFSCRVADAVDYFPLGYYEVGDIDNPDYRLVPARNRFVRLLPERRPEQVRREKLAWNRLEGYPPSGPPEPWPRSVFEFHIDRYLRWTQLVQAYTSMRLTRETDMLIAISGIARRIKEKADRTYLAGLWKDELALDLLWQPVDGERIKKYLAPSWSWAAISCTSVRFMDLHPKSEIFDFLAGAEGHIRTADDDVHKTGQVHGGHLFLKCISFQCVHSEDSYEGIWHISLGEQQGVTAVLCWQEPSESQSDDEELNEDDEYDDDSAEDCQDLEDDDDYDEECEHDGVDEMDCSEGSSGIAAQDEATGKPLVMAEKRVKFFPDVLSEMEELAEQTLVIVPLIVWYGTHGLVLRMVTPNVFQRVGIFEASFKLNIQGYSPEWLVLI